MTGVNGDADHSGEPDRPPRRPEESVEDYCDRIIRQETVDRIANQDAEDERRQTQSAYPGRNRRGQKPRKGMAYFIGLVASFVGIAGGSLALRGCVPETSDAAEAAHSALKGRIDGLQLHDNEQDRHLSAMEARLDSIDRNGERNVNLALRAALRSIDDDLRKLGPTGAGRINLERQRDQTCQDLSDSNAKLNYPRERCAQ